MEIAQSPILFEWVNIFFSLKIIYLRITLIRRLNPLKRMAWSLSLLNGPILKVTLSNHIYLAVTSLESWVNRKLEKNKS